MLKEVPPKPPEEPGTKLKFQDGSWWYVYPDVQAQKSRRFSTGDFVVLGAALVFLAIGALGVLWALAVAVLMLLSLLVRE